ncbi:MAG TPA: ATP-binding protein [Vicinamibacterales bacterium]|jgi:serine/threonine-protein kinase RsbW|nr:ATP-binding protein [Vicinamibacterales bacterium]
MSSLERRSYPSDVGELRAMSAWWRHWAESAGLGDDIGTRAELCLNEAISNIIRHGGAGAPITITLALEPLAVQITIVDEGPPFDPVTHPAADPPRTLEQARPGGLGVRIMRTSADDLDYFRLGALNTLTLTFFR